MKKIFGELDHRLSVVPRWGILHTIQHQSVAEHVFNVERIAVRIAEYWFGWGKDMLFHVYECAHHHEDFEALTGDVPTMVKPYLDEQQLEKDHAHLIESFDAGSGDLKNIIKLADKLEGYHFLCIENQLGNRYVTAHLAQEVDIIHDMVEKLWPNDAERIWELTNDVMKEMYVERSIRHSMRGR